jgi:hypothetical protein
MKGKPKPATMSKHMTLRRIDSHRGRYLALGTIGRDEGRDLGELLRHAATMGWFWR